MKAFLPIEQTRTMPHRPSTNWTVKEPAPRSGRRHFGEILHSNPAVPLLLLLSLILLGISKAQAQPTISGVYSYDGKSAGIEYNTAVDATSATNIANYSVTGTAVTNATLLADGQSVALWLNPQISGAFTVTVTNVKDLAENPIVPGSTASNVVLNLQLLAMGDATNEPYSATYVGNFATNVAGGSDIWQAGDNCLYQYLQVTNDFDYRLHVLSIQNVGNPFGRVGLMARDSLTDIQSHMVIAAVNAGPLAGSLAGSNSFQVVLRSTTDGGAESQPPNPLPPAYTPDTWVRLQRAGTVFTAYTSTNGIDWSQLYQFDGAASGDSTFTNSVLYLGIATSAHSSTTNTTAVVNDMGVTPHVPVSITTQPPAIALWLENSSRSLSVGASGYPIYYQWRTNNSGDVPVDIAGATNATYNVPLVQFSDAGTYSVLVSNELNSVVSSNSVVTVTTDTNPPTIDLVMSYDGTNVGVQYNKYMDPASATDPANYSVTGTTVTSVTLGADGRSVALWLASPISGPFTVTVNNVKDLALNTIIPGTTASGTVLGLQFTDFSTFQNVSASYTGTVATIVAGGQDIYGTQDTFDYAYLLVTNDFDYRLRVQSVTDGGGGTFTRAGLMARDLLDTDTGGSHEISAMVNQGNTFQVLVRPVANSNTVSQPGTLPVAYGSNSWVRLQRVSNVFTTYSSSNGVDWVQLYQFDSSSSSDGPFANPIYLGIAACAHIISGTTTATVSDMGMVPETPVNITEPPPASVVWLQNHSGSLTVGATGSPVHYQWMSNNVAIPGASNATYRIASAAPTDAGTYSVRVFNDVSAEVSSGTAVSVLTTTPTVIPVPDFSFEQPSVTGTFQDNSGIAVGTPLPGTGNAWYYLGGFAATGSPVGVQDASANGFTAGANPDGTQVGYANDGSWLGSSNLVTIQPNTTYVLLVSEGNRGGGFAQSSGFTIALAPGSSPTTSLITPANQLASLHVTYAGSPAVGTFADYSTGFTTGASDPAVGQSLFILLGSDVLGGVNPIDYDNVRLFAVSSSTPAPVISGFSIEGTNFVLQGSAGVAAAGMNYSVLTQTNLAEPLANWSVLSTGTLDGTGGFSVTNAVEPGTPQRFFQISIP